MSFKHYITCIREIPFWRILLSTFIFKFSMTLKYRKSKKKIDNPIFHMSEDIKPI